MIDVGTRVDVFFTHSLPLCGVEILYKPQATGDCWYVQDDDGTSYAIMTFMYMGETRK